MTSKILKLSVYVLSILMINMTICRSSKDLSNNNENYNWDEKTARTEVQREITNKLGKESFNWFTWLFLSDEEKNKQEIKNQEIREIKTIAEKEIASPDNYKRIMVNIPYVKWTTRVTKKPVKRVITEWKETRESVPETAFRSEQQKRWSEERVRNRLFGSIIGFIEAKSHKYVMDKTGNPVIANLVKQEVAADVLDKIRYNNCSLTCYLGKERDKKIEEIINNIMGKERNRENRLITEEDPTIPSAPEWDPSYADQNLYPVVPSAPEWDDMPSAPPIEG